MKVNLFAIGASKCGTTFMHDILDQHPRIFMSPVKEPRIFHKSSFSEELNSYQRLFDGWIGEKYLGESSPCYSETTTFPNTVKQIHGYNSEAKIIYIVRNPLDRLASVWIQAQSTGHWAEARSYGMKMPLIYRDAIFQYPPFLDACRYWTHIQSYLEYFSDEAIKVIFFEDFVSDTSAAMKDVFSFLGIDTGLELDFDSGQRNASTTKTMFNPWPKRLQRVLLRAIGSKIPDVLRQRVENLSWLLPTAKLRPPILSAEERREIAMALNDEVRALYSYLAIPNDRWGFFNLDTQKLSR